MCFDNAMSYHTIAILPKPGDTKATIDERRVSEVDGHPTEITCLVMGQARLQFTTPADAVAWVDECRDLLVAQMPMDDHRTMIGRKDAETDRHPHHEWVAGSMMTGNGEHVVSADCWTCTGTDRPVAAAGLVRA